MNQRDFDKKRENAKKYTLENVSAECFLWENIKGQPVVSGYSGRRTKPDFYYRYRSTNEAINEINKFLERIQSDNLKDVEYKKEQKKKKIDLFKSVGIGSIFVSSWGYDQTNVDCYQVIEKKGNSTVIIREVGQKRVKNSEGFDCCRVKPIKDCFLEDSKPFEKRINAYGIRIESYSHAYLWDGERDYYNSWYC